MSMLLDPKWQTTALAPLMRLFAGKGYATEQQAKTALGALMAPGEVLKNPGLMINPETGRTSDYAISRSADLAGMMTLGSGAIPAEANSLRMGIKAYHGSPHDFDRFDMSKIGTGEGAQAYGHGLYFAENEGVARSYRDALAVDPRDEINKLIEGARNWGGATFDQVKNGEVAQRLKLSDEQIRDVIQAINGHDNGAVSDAAMNAYRRLDKSLPSAPSGSMYEVNIDANPDDFLDWDKPLSEQGPRVQQALNPLLDEYVRPSDFKVDFERGPIPVADRHGGHTKPDKFMVSLKDPNGQVGYVGFGDNRDDAMKDALAGIMPTTGARAYERLARGFDKSPAQMWGIGSGATSQALKEQGIPGIKYLDAGSRGAGDGSRNYVVFDDKLISIVKKYGVAALVSAGVLSQAQGEEMKAQGYY
jgi:hypothetical protein